MSEQIEGSYCTEKHNTWDKLYPYGVTPLANHDCSEYSNCHLYHTSLEMADEERGDNGLVELVYYLMHVMLARMHNGDNPLNVNDDVPDKFIDACFTLGEHVKQLKHGDKNE